MKRKATGHTAVRARRRSGWRISRGKRGIFRDKRRIDPDARLPEFLHLLHRLVASCRNASLGRTDNFWAAEHASIVALESADDVIEKIAYVSPTRRPRASCGPPRTRRA